jgi:DNA-binding NarL/FixJ family response regulator
MARLDDEDIAVAAMLLAGTSHQGIAEALRIDRSDVTRRARRIVTRLRPTGSRSRDGDRDPGVTHAA